MSNPTYEPRVFKQDESAHWYLIPEDKAERFNELLYPDANYGSDEWRESVAKFEEEFAHYRGSRPDNTTVYVKT